MRLKSASTQLPPSAEPRIGQPPNSFRSGMAPDRFRLSISSVMGLSPCLIMNYMIVTQRINNGS